MIVNKIATITSTKTSLFTYVLLVFAFSLLARAGKCTIRICLYLRIAKTIVV